jgi:hypothetical protein
MKSPIHEAGHAVLARILDFPVVWVSLDQAFIDNDPFAIRSEATGFGPVCMTVSSERLAPVLRRGWITTKAERETVIGYMIHVMAGPMAEQGVDSASFNRVPSERDFQQAAAILAACVPNKATRKQLYKQAVKELDRLLDVHWTTIMRVAAVLDERRTLMADELDALIWADEMREAA